MGHLFSSKKKKTQSFQQSPLMQAQYLKVTRSGLPINQSVTTKILNKKTLDKMRKSTSLVQDVLVILNPPFSDVDRICDHLYLTGVAGLLEENIRSLRITCIINATYEMPLVKILGVETYRVPVDDDEEEQIIFYFDDVANLINSVAKKGGRTIVHCMAGASRSSTLVLAYLIKYQDMTLKQAFCYVKSLRSCARPNIGFFEQLIRYEKFLRNQSSVNIIEIVEDGFKFRIPDIYQTKFPDLYKAEKAKQLSNSQYKIKQYDKYLNQRRHYKEINRDIQNQTKRL